MTNRDRAFDSGRAEAYAGVRLRQNPYDKDADFPLWVAWRSGWMFGAEDRVNRVA